MAKINTSATTLGPLRPLKLEETPAWYGANEYILTNYRPESRSALTSLRSWTYLHNESGNIYSHLIPTVISLAAQWYLIDNYIPFQYPLANWSDRLVLSFHLCTTVACLGLSTLYHTFMNHSVDAAKRWLLYDYMGIITLILGDFVSGIYFGFYCESFLKVIYWAMIAVLGLLTATILLNPRYQGQEWRSFRLTTFVCTCLSAFAPMVHAAMLFGLYGVWQVGVPYYLSEGLVMAIAVYFYERQIPERLYPGKFDIWGHSHTIFHILVVLGTCIHFFGLISAFDYDYNYRSCHV